MSSLARDVAVVGVGYSPLARSGGPDPRTLTYTAVSNALADAGLKGADVDAIFEYKFGPESPGAQDVARMIGSPDLAAFADIFPSGPSGLAGALAAAMAVEIPSTFLIESTIDCTALTTLSVAACTSAIWVLMFDTVMPYLSPVTGPFSASYSASSCSNVVSSAAARTEAMS